MFPLNNLASRFLFFSSSPYSRVFGAHSSNPAMSIIGAEDEDFENDLNEVSPLYCVEYCFAG